MASDLTSRPSRSRHLRFWWIPAIAFLGFSTREAIAEPTAADRATARLLAQEGGQALDRQEYELAADRFARADALVHLPTLVLELAHAQVGLGKFVEAHENLLRILREGIDPNAPPLLQRAYKTAQVEEKEIAERIAWVNVHFDSAGAPLTMTLDGEELPKAALDVKRAVNPGKHTLRISGEGYRTNETSFDVSEGKTVSLTVSAEKLARRKTHTSDGHAATPASQPPATSASAAAGSTHATTSGSVAPGKESASDSSTANSSSAFGSTTPVGTTWVPTMAPTSQQRLGAWISVGLGGAAVIVGGVAGLLAMGDKKLLERSCTGEDCPLSARSDVDHYHAMANISTVACTVGAVALATGLVLHWATPKREGTRLEAFAGFGTAGAKVTFE